MELLQFIEESRRCATQFKDEDDDVSSNCILTCISVMENIIRKFKLEVMHYFELWCINKVECCKKMTEFDSAFIKELNILNEVLLLHCDIFKTEEDYYTRYKVCVDIINNLFIIVNKSNNVNQESWDFIGSDDPLFNGY
jgi:hypothetical protein